MVSDVLEDQQQTISSGSEREIPGERQSNPGRTNENNGDGKRGDCKLWSSKGSWSRGARCAFTQDDQKSRERG